ncbi:MAG: MerR family transcriptional regulator [Verrucomicrobiales bacterium]|nr:MerR family transcriptional regulator [Verrucomicrobiales bacterium]
MDLTVDQLAERVTQWCAQHRVVPANGQVATETQPRTLRYYRTMGLLDAPTAGGGQGYGERHFLQACAVRVLQAEGLPLSRIQALLFGRSDDELRQTVESAVSGETRLPDVAAAPVVQPETWQTFPISPELMLVSRRPGLRLTPAQLSAIQSILESSST